MKAYTWFKKKKEQTTVKTNNLGEFHRYKNEQKKSDSKK